jgi:signal transduction histidine kinase
MVLLGEQLITDEVAAVSELVKNAYDADAKKVKLILKDVSDPTKGMIQIIDNGNGMSKDVIVNGWLELATTLKARTPEEKRRRSKKFKRPMLGEKGLGRLAVHKLGTSTEIASRARGSNKEVVLRVEWEQFEDREKYLENVPVTIEEREPEQFIPSRLGEDFLQGTMITVTRVRGNWNKERLTELSQKMQLISSPLSGMRNFHVELQVADPLFDSVKPVDYKLLEKNAIYTFSGNISRNGELQYDYEFRRSDYPSLCRKVAKKQSLLDPEHFKEGRNPTCGPFKLVMYSWEGLAQDIRLVFGTAGYYEEIVRPNTGIKLFRDGFRVLPYGDYDEDWLNLNQRRIERFEKGISKNLIIGFIDISSKDNPYLVDKSDREGLIDNGQFRDFYRLVKNSLGVFENLRLVDRDALKRKAGRSKTSRIEGFTDSIKRIQGALRDPVFEKVPYEKRKELLDLTVTARRRFEEVIEETENPLLVAAGIGITAMIPTHEARRDLQEAIKLLAHAETVTKDEVTLKDVNSALELLRQADDVVGSITRIQQKSAYEEQFSVTRPVELAEKLFRYRFDRQNIDYSHEFRTSFTIKGSSRLITVALLNMFDNSSYWLLRKKGPERREVKLIVDEVKGDPAIIISDNGAGIQDDLKTITMPFYTTKPNGMGLGLYICDRVAENHEARLELLSQNTVRGLLPGANIAMVFPRATVNPPAKRR